MPPNALTLELPLSPSFNAMLELAKKRTRRSRRGGFMRRSLPVVYDQELEKYELQCAAALARQGIEAPASPWPRWQIVSSTFRLYWLRDPVELNSSLKWPVDVLVRLRYVKDDSPRELLPVPPPHQVIDRRNLGVTLHISEA